VCELRMMTSMVRKFVVCVGGPLDSIFKFLVYECIKTSCWHAGVWLAAQTVESTLRCAGKCDRIQNLN
jgi:hypothetical protein